MMTSSRPLVNFASILDARDESSDYVRRTQWSSADFAWRMNEEIASDTTNSMGLDHSFSCNQLLLFG